MGGRIYLWHTAMNRLVKASPMPFFYFCFCF
jgi:hypothetical protein